MGHTFIRFIAIISISCFAHLHGMQTQFPFIFTQKTHIYDSGIIVTGKPVVQNNQRRYFLTAYHEETIFGSLELSYEQDFLTLKIYLQEFKTHCGSPKELALALKDVFINFIKNLMNQQDDIHDIITIIDDTVNPSVELFIREPEVTPFIPVYTTPVATTPHEIIKAPRRA